MAKRKVELTDQQKQVNDQILARIEAERQRLYQETRELQRRWKSKSGRKRSGSGSTVENMDFEE